MAGLTAVSADELAALEIFEGCRPDALVPLAAQLRPLNAAAGRVLMRQGERAESFLLIGSGRAEVTHTGSDGVPTVLELSPPLIVGEIALLRDAPRTATVVATEPLTGWVGGHGAFAAMLDVPGMMDKLVRTARQRLAAFITPIPVQMRDGTRSCTCGRCCRATASAPRTARSSSPVRRCTAGSRRPARRPRR